MGTLHEKLSGANSVTGGRAPAFQLGQAARMSVKQRAQGRNGTPGSWGAITWEGQLPAIAGSAWDSGSTVLEGNGKKWNNPGEPARMARYLPDHQSTIKGPHMQSQWKFSLTPMSF